MMASSFIMDFLSRPPLRPCYSVLLGLQIVGFFAVLRYVQTFHFLLFVSPEARNQIGDFQNYDGADQRKAPGHQHPYELGFYLRPVAVPPAHWTVPATHRINDFLSKNDRKQRANP